MNSTLSKNILTAVILLALATGVSAADRTNDRDQQAGQNKGAKKAQSATALKPAAAEGATTPATTSKPTETPAVKPLLTTLQAPASPLAGEQIKWQVISGGGVKGTSASYILTGTVGQTAAGPGTSASFKVNQGFWQNFTTSCCVGVTGDVNTSGSVNLADLSALVSYLTGGGYVPPCPGEADVNANGSINLADLSALASFLTGGGYVLPSCS